MLRKYVAGFIAMRYVRAEFVLAVSVLILAYINDRLFPDRLRYGILACIAGIVVILIMYVRDRIRTARQLEGIQDQGEYENAVVLGNAFFLENRVAAYAGGNVIEDDYSGITDAELLTGRKSNLAVRLTIRGKTYDAQAATPQQAERLAAFLKKKNPEIRLHDLKANGPGTWKSIDLVPAERATLGG